MSVVPPASDGSTPASDGPIRDLPSPGAAPGPPLPGGPAPVRGPGDAVALFLATGFGSGYSPVAPGTAGTVVAALLVYALSFTALPAGPTLLVLAGLSTAVSIAVGTRVERLLGRKDPGAFVLDEFAGYFVAALVLSSAWPTPAELVVAFVLFRLFDVAKPQPCRWLQGLGGGAGIVLDDVAAGLYALAGVIVYRDVMQAAPW